MQTENKTKYLRVAAVTAIAGNAILAVLKIVAGLLSGSGALVGDGVDSAADALTGVITLIVVRMISKPADIEHPWGHGRAETVSTMLLSFVIFFAGAQLIISSISGLISGVADVTPSALAVGVTIASIVGKVLLAASQFALGKRADSAMIKANAKNMASDVLSSVGVLAGLIISSNTGSAYADAVIAVLIGALVIRTAVGIFREANLELMDGNNDMEPYRVLVRAVNAVDGASNPHHARIRRIAGFWDIDFDIDVDPDCTVLEAHGIASRVEQEIKRQLENVYDIMIHIEPRGNDDAEVYGLSESDMCGEPAEY